MDEVRISFRVPNEDEFALCQMTLCSPLPGPHVPSPAVVLRSVPYAAERSEAVKARWKSALVHFLKKLTWKYDRPLV